MKKIKIAILIALAYTPFIFAQVGVGTTTPSAELEVQTTATGLPALELNPQTAPTGTADGQLSVVGDKLYMFDTSRADLGTSGKWLSIETTALKFGRNGNVDNIVLKKAGNSSSGNSSYLMPFDGTIVYASIKSNANSGAQSKQFLIRVRKGTTNVSTTSVTTSSSEFLNTAFNVNFSAGDYIDVRVQTDGNGNVNNPVATLWIKWRM